MPSPITTTLLAAAAVMAGIEADVASVVFVIVAVLNELVLWLVRGIDE